jgi:hypothetical protein
MSCGCMVGGEIAGHRLRVGADGGDIFGTINFLGHRSGANLPHNFW